VSIDQRGVFAELMYPASDSNRIIAGLRYDYVRSNASKADVDPDMPPLSPNDLYAIYYDGAQAEKRTEHNWGGLLRWEHDLDSGLGSVYAGISRTVRTADATERFIASNAMMPSMRWVGNPLIDPEKHHQVEVGAVVGEGPWQVDASVFYNDVSDYILRWRYHQPDNNATVYKNVDARLIGGEATLSWRLTDHWQTGAGIAYVWANNDTDDLPIAQIPPFSGFVSVDYLADKWQAGARVNAAAQQNRVDDDPRTGSGLDTGETPGWAILNLYGRYAFSDSLALDAGIDNLFDKAYANHLNRANAFDPVQVQVNEPGRSFWARLTATF
jgi:iron complex outermembrane receptor protein